MKGVASNCVTTTELVEATGVPAVDDALYSLVKPLSLGVGDSLRAVFLLGSYADGSNAPDSDLDLCLLLKEGTWAQVRRRAASLVARLSRTLPRREVEACRRTKGRPYTAAPASRWLPSRTAFWRGPG